MDRGWRGSGEVDYIDMLLEMILILEERNKSLRSMMRRRATSSSYCDGICGGVWKKPAPVVELEGSMAHKMSPIRI